MMFVGSIDVYLVDILSLIRRSFSLIRSSAACYHEVPLYFVAEDPDQLGPTPSAGVIHVTPDYD